MRDSGDNFDILFSVALVFQNFIITTVGIFFALYSEMSNRGELVIEVIKRGDIMALHLYFIQ